MRRKQKQHAMIENLEHRLLMTAAVQSVMTFGSPGSDNVAVIETDAAGNVYVGGGFSGSIDLDPGAGVYTLTTGVANAGFVAKYAANGNLVWAHAVGTTVSGITVDGAGNVYVAGMYTQSFDADPGAGVTTLTVAGQSDGYVVKFSGAGTFQWASNFGSAGFENARKVFVNGNGDVFVAVEFQQTVDFDPGVADLSLSQVTSPSTVDNALVTYDSNGNVISATRGVRIAAMDGNGNFYGVDNFTGTLDVDPGAGTYQISSELNAPMYIAKYDATLQVVWAKVIEGSAVLNTGLTVDGSGGVVVTGFFGFTMDADPGEGTATLVEYICPDAFTGYVLKLDANGNYQWARAFNSDTGWSTIWQSRADAFGNVYIVGEFNDTVAFGTGQGTATLSSPGQDSAFVAKYDAAGRLVWVSALGNAGNERGQSLALGSGGNIYLGGYYGADGDFDAGPGTLSVTNAGNSDGFLVTLVETPNAVNFTLNAGALAANTSSTLSATVATNLGVATGNVSFYADGNYLGTASLDENGVASIATSALTLGSHALSAVYDGDSNFAGANDTVNVNIFANAAPMGSLDIANNGKLVGWAWDANSDSNAISIRIVIDGFTRGIVSASNTRSDLQSALGSSGHGFVFVMPMLKTGVHTVQVFMQDSNTGNETLLATKTITSASSFFDENYYRTRYADVNLAVTQGYFSSGWEHFQLFGNQEGRDPSAYFNQQAYLAKYADVASAVQNGFFQSAFDHFVQFGQFEGRMSNSFFNETAYKAMHSDVSNAVIGGYFSSGFEHFVLYGVNEGRAPSGLFDDAYYKAHNLDVKNAVLQGFFCTAFEHFLRFGQFEGRLAHA